MLCIAGFDGYFKKLNQAWTLTLGFTEEELQARPYLEFVHPDDRKATITEAAKCTQGFSVVWFENRFICRNGSYRWLLWHAATDMERGLMRSLRRASAYSNRGRKSFASALTPRMTLPSIRAET